MKKSKAVSLIVVSAIIAVSGFLALFIDSVIKPFLDGHEDVKLIITFSSVLCAYHTLLMASINARLEKIEEQMAQQIKKVDSKIEMLKEAVPYDMLDDIEFRHGHNNVNCEIWVISNTLQEAGNDDSMLQAIYENITKNRISYYYVLPKTKQSKREIGGLHARLNEIHERSKEKILTGEISYKYLDNLSKLIPSDYYDIVLYVDCDDNGNPYTLGDAYTCEGFQCFSNVLDDNSYLYQPIDEKRIQQIRDFYKSDKTAKFEKITIGERPQENASL